MLINLKDSMVLILKHSFFKFLKYFNRLLDMEWHKVHELLNKQMMLVNGSNQQGKKNN